MALQRIVDAFETLGNCEIRPSEQQFRFVFILICELFGFAKGKIPKFRFTAHNSKMLRFNGSGGSLNPGFAVDSGWAGEFSDWNSGRNFKQTTDCQLVSFTEWARLVHTNPPQTAFV